MQAQKTKMRKKTVRAKSAAQRHASSAMQPTPLITQLAAQVVDHIRNGSFQPGQRVTERGLADLFRVSRSPVRGALAVLQERGVVTPGERVGFVISPTWDEAPAVVDESPSGEEEEIYLQIADDRLSGRLPDRISENELLRRYDLTRGRLTRILRRMANEGWIERLPGHGWAFQPVLASLEAYEDSYRFRQVIEPAAILEPRFTLNRPALERRREEQQWLVDGGVWKVSDVRLFELNSGTHETIIECSHNSFFIDALKRIDRLRRLIEYRQTLDRPKALIACREHVQLLDLVLADRRQEASDFLRRHLGELRVLKTAAQKTRATSPGKRAIAAE